MVTMVTNNFLYKGTPKKTWELGGTPPYIGGWWGTFGS